MIRNIDNKETVQRKTTTRRNHIYNSQTNIDLSIYYTLSNSSVLAALYRSSTDKC